MLVDWLLFAHFDYLYDVMLTNTKLIIVPQAPQESWWSRGTHTKYYSSDFGYFFQCKIVVTINKLYTTIIEIVYLIYFLYVSKKSCQFVFNFNFINNDEH